MASGKLPEFLSPTNSPTPRHGLRGLRIGLPGAWSKQPWTNRMTRTEIQVSGFRSRSRNTS
jgi:hypothetical protein